MTDLAPTIGKELRRRREAAGLSREEVALRAGYAHPNSIAHIETGHHGVSHEAFVKIATVLDIPADEWPAVLRLPKDEPAAEPDPTPSTAAA